MRIGPDPFIDVISRPQTLRTGFGKIPDDKENTKPFDEVLRIVMTGSSEKQSELSAVSRGETAKLLIGEEDNLIDNMVAGEKSSIMFELNLNIRTKVLDAYNEIMRTQV